MTEPSKTSSERQPGFYWVSDGGKWQVAEWRKEGKRFVWYCAGDEVDYSDEAFDEIDERPIVKTSSGLPDFSRLGKRQRMVLGLVGQGMNNKDIAQQLGISPKTVKKHKEMIKAKFGVDSWFELMKIAMQFADCQRQQP